MIVDQTVKKKKQTVPFGFLSVKKKNEAAFIQQTDCAVWTFLPPDSLTSFGGHLEMTHEISTSPV